MDIKRNADTMAFCDDNDDIDDIESAWSKFCDDDLPPQAIPTNDIATSKDCIPKCSPLNISTKTKISYLVTIITFL